MASKTSQMDLKLCQEISDCIDKLTTSGKPHLDANAMKHLKKICKQSDEYVTYTHGLLMTQLNKEHAEIRLSAFQISDELFNRSHAFRELILADFKDFMDLTTEADPEYPLPLPKAAAKTLKRSALDAIHKWNEKYGNDYKKLSLGCNYLKNCKKMDFTGTAARTQAEQRRMQEQQQRQDVMRRQRLENVLKEMSENSLNIKDVLIQIENCLKLLLPDPESFQIHGLMSPEYQPSYTNPFKSYATRTPAEVSTASQSAKKTSDISKIKGRRKSQKETEAVGSLQIKKEQDEIDPTKDHGHVTVRNLGSNLQRKNSEGNSNNDKLDNYSEKSNSKEQRDSESKDGSTKKGTSKAEKSFERQEKSENSGSFEKESISKDEDHSKRKSYSKDKNSCKDKQDSQEKKTSGNDTCTNDKERSKEQHVEKNSKSDNKSASKSKNSSEKSQKSKDEASSKEHEGKERLEQKDNSKEPRPSSEEHHKKESSKEASSSRNRSSSKDKSGSKDHRKSSESKGSSDKSKSQKGKSTCKERSSKEGRNSGSSDKRSSSKEKTTKELRNSTEQSQNKDLSYSTENSYDEVELSIKKEIDSENAISQKEPYDLEMTNSSNNRLTEQNFEKQIVQNHNHEPNKSKEKSDKEIEVVAIKEHVREEATGSKIQHRTDTNNSHKRITSTEKDSEKQTSVQTGISLKDTNSIKEKSKYKEKEKHVKDWLLSNAGSHNTEDKNTNTGITPESKNQETTIQTLKRGVESSTHDNGETDQIPLKMIKLDPRISVNRETGTSDQEDFEEISTPSSSDDEDNVSESDVVRDHGLMSQLYRMQVEINPADIAIQETEDNSDILHALRDLARQVKGKFLPQVVRWLEVLSKTGAEQSEVQKAIDIKNALEVAKKRTCSLRIQPRAKPAVKPEMKDSKDDDDEDEDDDDFEDVPTKEGYEDDIPKHLRPPTVPKVPKAPTSTSWQFPRVNIKKRKISEELDPTTPQATLKKLLAEHQIKEEPSSIKKEDQAASSCRDPSVPVIPFGTDLFQWGEKKETPLVVRYESAHRFWNSAFEEEDIVDKVALESMSQRTINFTGKFEPVKWSCRAPLNNGTLCPRQDRYKCPFHGKVIPRNNMGQPSNPEDAKRLAEEELKKRQDQLAEWEDPDLQAEIEAATGVSLNPAGSNGKGQKKGKKRKESGLTDIKKLQATTKTRLERKVLSQKALRRVEDKMANLNHRKYRDKYGNNFNYALN